MQNPYEADNHALRKRYSGALAEIERLQFIMAGSGLGSWDWYLNTNEVSFDRAWCSMLGLDFETTPQNLDTWSSRVHPDDLARAYHNVQQHLAGKTPVYENIHRMRHANGTWISILDRGRISQFDANGKPLRITSVHLDITEYKAAEEISENIQRMASIGGWDLDVATNVSRWSDETYRIHGVPIGTPMNKFAGINFYAPHERERITRCVERCMAGTPYRETFEFIDAQGNHKWVEAMGQPIRDADGKIRRLSGTFQDVTEKVEMQLQRENIAKELRQFFDVTLELLCIADLNGWFRKLNPAWTSTLGYSEEELKSQPFATFVMPEDIPSTLEAMKRLEHGDAVVGFENRFRAKDGTYKVLSWSSTVDRKLGLIFAAARDVTEVRKREGELRQTLDAINRSAIVTVTDRDGKILQANDNFCAISGFSREELLGQDHRMVSSGVHPPAFFANLWETVLAGKVWTGEVENRCRSGSRYVVQTVITPLTGIDGNVERMLAIRFDITARKELERLLNDAQRVAKIGSWSFEVASQRIWWSPQMFEMFAADPEKGPPLFQEHLASIHPDDQLMWKETVHRALKSGSPYKIRFRSIYPDGNCKWVDAYGEARLDRQGAVIELNGTCQDVTDAVIAEETIRLERAKALQNAKLASLGEMSAGIAHEINNPLAIIAGTAHSLKKFVSDPVKFSARVDTIERATGRIAKIVSGLRKFSRTAGVKEMKAHVLLDIVREALVLAEPKSRRHSVPVELTGQSETQIFCDEIEIEQVLVNLINNAIDAVADTKEKWVRLEILDHEDNVICRVRDSGPGIPPQVREKMFQPFFTTKPVGEGTGLGLAIAKGILQEHQASIECLTLDAHTCFEIRFKRAGGVQNDAT